MFPKPAADLRPNTYEFEVKPLIKATGFREYDARWWFGVPGHKTAPELNLVGVTALGMGIGTLLGEFGVKREVIVGHDYRAYSSSIKLALATGLMAGGGAGYRLAQRERLDRREDGLAPAGDLRAGGNHPAEGDRLRRFLRPEGRRRVHFRGRIRREVHRRPHQPAEAEAADQGGRRLRQRHRGRFRRADTDGDRRR